MFPKMRKWPTETHRAGWGARIRTWDGGIKIRFGGTLELGVYDLVTLRHQSHCERIPVTLMPR